MSRTMDADDRDEVMMDDQAGETLAEAHLQHAMLDSDDDDDEQTSAVMSASHMNTPPSFNASRRSRRRSVLGRRSKPTNIRTPSSPMASTIPHNNLPSAPASPPTPAPSPSLGHRLPDWSTADESEEAASRELRFMFTEASEAQKKRLLTEILNLCNNRQLTYVHDIVCPRLKKDPFTTLPNEICLRILSFVDKARTLGRAAQVSRRWHELVSDDITWKVMGEKYAYRRLSNESDLDMNALRTTPSPSEQSPPMTFTANFNNLSRAFTSHAGSLATASNSAPDLTLGADNAASSSSNSNAAVKQRTKHTSYRSQFKRRYMVETAWRTGGKMHSSHITPDQGVVTSLHLTQKYIVVALDNAKIHVFDTQGTHQRTLHGHIMGVWAMVPWGDILVSGGCDRDVRVWNMATGQNLHVMRGHSSTVRCLKMSDSNTAITGSRDTTLRIWDVTKGQCKHVLIGHQASVRCVEVHGDLIASGSYDTTARIWSISQGKCLRVLAGHFSQIYAIAFDGRRVATGSLDTGVRIWDVYDGKCLAVLQGHTSLVGQLQMRGDTLVTGGSDGSVRVWSLDKYVPFHRLAAHDNSVTSLEFNESRIVSGGSDGRVKVWDLRTGTLVRELSQPAESVWRVVFEEEKAVIMANRGQRTIMEVWSFAPPEEDLNNRTRSSSSVPATERSKHRRSLEAGNLDVSMSDGNENEGPSNRSGRRKLFQHNSGVLSSG